MSASITFKVVFLILCIILQIARYSRELRSAKKTKEDTPEEVNKRERGERKRGVKQQK